MIKNLLTGLAALVFTFAPAAATARGNKHPNYSSVGIVTEAAVKGEELKFTAGINVTRRFPLADKIGLMFGYSMQLAPKKNILGEMIMKGKLDISIGGIAKNLELFVGPGFWLAYNEAYFAPQIGLRYHFGKKKGFYLSGEAGPLIKSDAGGGFLEFGMGYRWDSPI